MINNQNPVADQGTNSPRRRRGAIGLVGGLLAGTAAGVAFGVPGLTSASSADVAGTAVVQQADESGPAPDAVPDREPGERLRETLQALVDDGTITAEQADAVTAQLIENRPDRPGLGDREPGERRGGPGSFGRGVGSEALTDLLGLDAQELRGQIREGATLGEIADAQGVDPRAVVDELVAELAERLDNAVENGRLDRADADEKLPDAEARISNKVTNGRN